MSNTPEYLFGLAWGRAARKFNDGMRRIVEGLQAGLAGEPMPDEFYSLEARERRSERAYRLRIEQERQIGRAFVKGVAARARKELGLP